MARPRLIIIGPSHFCERARWGLDHAGIAFDEECWAPALHIPQARRLAPKTSLPILVAPDAVIQGSDRILDWLGTPGGDDAIENRLSEVIAPLVRRYLYSATLHDPRSGIREALLGGVTGAQYWAARLGWPLIRRLMATKMDTSPRHLPDLERRLDAELAWFDGVADGRDHLVGTRLGRADITAASLLAPLLRGPAVNPMYERVRLPDRVEQALVRWNHGPGLGWVRRLYRDHRSYSPATRSR